MNWQIAAEIAEVVASISIVIALLQFGKEISESRWQSFFYLHDYISQSQFSDARKAVRTYLYKKPYETWDENDKTAANRVCTCYDQAGILISQRLLTKKSKIMFLKSSWGKSIVEQYEALKPFLDDKQTPELTGRQFFKHFTWLYEEAAKYQKEASNDNKNN